MQEQNETNLNRAPVWRAFRAAAPQTLPVFAGYLVLGLGYGIYVQSLGPAGLAAAPDGYGSVRRLAVLCAAGADGVLRMQKGHGIAVSFFVLSDRTYQN